MIRELIIGVSVAVIGVGAHAATAQAATELGSCTWSMCYSGECPGDGGYDFCRETTPPGCFDAVPVCYSNGAECGIGGSYIECDAIQIE